MATIAGVQASMTLESAGFIAGTRRATQAMNDFATRSAAANKTVQREFVRTAAASRNLRGITQQLGFQLQDVIVQLQAGQRASVIFAQQGSQIAAAFGPVGAVVGVVIAAVGGLAGALLGMARDTDSADAATERFAETQDNLQDLLKNSTKQIRDQVAAIGELEGAARGFAERAFAGTLDTAQAELDKQTQQLQGTLGELRRTLLEGGDLPEGTLDLLSLTRSAALAESSELIQAIANRVRALLDQIDDPRLGKLADDLGDAGLAAVEAQKRVDELTGAVGDLARDADLTNVNALIRDFEQGQKDAERATKDAARASEAAAREREREQRSAIQLQDKLLDGLKREALAIDKAADRADEKAAREQERRQDQLARDLDAEAQRQAELIARPFNNALDSVQNSFTATFENIFSGGVTSFSDLADEIKRIFIRLAAEVAVLSIFSPRAVLGAAGAVGALAPGAAAGGTPSLASSLGFGGILDELGFQLGFASPAGTPGGATPGFFGGTATLGQTATFAGLGAAGGGLIGSQFGGQGALGGAIGGATGAAAGAIIGSAFFGVGAPIGALIGGLIGTAAGGGIGSLFGGSERNRGTISGGLGNVSARGTGDLDTVAAVVAGVDDAILDLLNIRQRQIVDQALRGTQIQTDFNEFDQRVGDFVAGERVRDISRALGFRASGVAPGNATADQAVQNLATALQVQRAIEDLTGAVSPFERQIEELNLRFADLNEKARRFGISTEGLIEAQTRATADLQRTQDAALGALFRPFEALIDPLADFQRQLEFAGQNPAERFASAQADFDRLAQAALGGSTAAIAQLDEAGALLIAQATQVGASPAGAEARSAVLEVVQEVLDEVREAQEISGREVTNELRRLSDQNNLRLDELIELTKAEIKEIRRTGDK